MFRYLFYATPQRAETDEYNPVEDDVFMDNAEVSGSEVPQMQEDQAEATDVDEIPDVDPAIADWFKVDQNVHSSGQNKESSDTETEADSDHDGLHPDDDEDEWLNIKPADAFASGSGNVEAVRFTLNTQIASDDFHSRRLKSN